MNIEHLELWRWEMREDQRDRWDEAHERAMNEAQDERAFDGEDAEEWQRRSDESGASEG